MGKSLPLWSCLSSYAIAVVMTVASLHGAAQSGGGANGSTASVQRTGRAGALVYPNGVTTTKADATQSASVPLRIPTSFDSAGIYVWKDTDGSWSLGLISPDNGMSFAGEIIASSAITIEPADNSDGTLQGVNASHARLEFAPAGKVTHIVRFRTDAHWIDFSLYANGTDGFAPVFIGSSNLNPTSMPFRIVEQARGLGATLILQQTASPEQPSEVSSSTGTGAGPGVGRR